MTDTEKKQNVFDAYSKLYKHYLNNQARIEHIRNSPVLSQDDERVYEASLLTHNNLAIESALNSLRDVIF